MKLPLISCILLFWSFAPVRGAEDAVPPSSIATNSRVFEIRTYYAAPGKLQDLHARFRNHTNKLFVKHGMELIGYWVPTDAAQGADNKLIYILAYPSREAAAKSWDGFRKDPEWASAREASEVNGKLVEKVESVFLKATDYSPIK